MHKTDDGPICTTLTSASATDQCGLLVYSKLRSIEESSETSVNNIKVAAYEDGYEGIGGFGYCHYLFLTKNSPSSMDSCCIYRIHVHVQKKASVLGAKIWVVTPQIQML